MSALPLYLALSTDVNALGRYVLSHLLHRFYRLVKALLCDERSSQMSLSVPRRAPDVPRGSSWFVVFRSLRTPMMRVLNSTAIPGVCSKVSPPARMRPPPWHIELLPFNGFALPLSSLNSASRRMAITKLFLRRPERFTGFMSNARGQAHRMGFGKA